MLQDETSNFVNTFELIINQSHPETSKYWTSFAQLHISTICSAVQIREANAPLNNIHWKLKIFSTLKFSQSTLLHIIAMNMCALKITSNPVAS